MVLPLRLSARARRHVLVHQVLALHTLLQQRRRRVRHVRRGELRLHVCASPPPHTPTVAPREGVVVQPLQREQVAHALQALRQLQTDLQRQEGVPSVQRARGPYGSLLSFSDTPIFVSSSFTRIRSTPHAASAPPLRLCTSWKRATTKSDRTMLSYSDQNRYSRNRGSKDC